MIKNHKCKHEQKNTRISSTEHTIEEVDSSVKENIKPNKSLIQNIQEIWDVMKRPKLRIIGIKEGEEVQLKSTKTIFNKIIEQTFPNLKKKDMPMKIQEAYTTPNRLDKKVLSPLRNQNTKHTA